MPAAVYQVSYSKCEKRSLGERVFDRSIGLYAEWQSAKAAIDQELAGEGRDKQKDPPDEESAEDWFLYFLVTTVSVDDPAAGSQIWVFDASGKLLDGSIETPDGEPLPERIFTHNQIVGFVLEQTAAAGVICGQRQVALPTGALYQEFDIQTAISSPDHGAYRRWVPRPMIFPLLKEDVAKHHPRWLALELLDDDVLTCLEAQLNHVTQFPKSKNPLELPSIVQSVLGKGALLFALQRSVLEAPGWAHADPTNENLGHFSSMEVALTAMHRHIAEDPHSKWIFTGLEASPLPLVLNYNLSIDLLDDKFKRELGDRVAEATDFFWVFDRRGAFLGMVEFGCGPSNGAETSTLRFKTGDVIALNRSQHHVSSECRGFEIKESMLSPAVIAAVPPTPEVAKRRGLEASDLNYLIENGNVYPIIYEDFEELPEAWLTIYEAPISSFQKRRLARLLAPEEITAAIQNRFHFGANPAKS